MQKKYLCCILLCVPWVCMHLPCMPFLLPSSIEDKSSSFHRLVPRSKKAREQIHLLLLLIY
uniref:Uncharacterized protein n=1 Tax=Arundo donax TaxID=35708 RepID=A0A0A9DS40_ARUDO